MLSVGSLTMTRVIANLFLRFPAFFDVDVESPVVALTLGAADEGIIMRSTLSLHFGSLCDLWRGLAKVEKLRVSRDACKRNSVCRRTNPVAS